MRCGQISVYDERIYTIHFTRHWHRLTVHPALPIRDDKNAKWTIKAGVGVFKAEVENIGGMPSSSKQKREASAGRRENNSTCLITRYPVTMPFAFNRLTWPLEN